MRGGQPGAPTHRQAASPRPGRRGLPGTRAPDGNPACATQGPRPGSLAPTAHTHMHMRTHPPHTHNTHSSELHMPTIMHTLIHTCTRENTYAHTTCTLAYTWTHATHTIHVHMHAHVYTAHMYVHTPLIHVHTHHTRTTHSSEHMPLILHTHLYTPVHVRTHIHTHTCIHMCARHTTPSMYMHVYMHTLIHVHTHTHHIHCTHLYITASYTYTPHTCSCIHTHADTPTNTHNTHTNTAHVYTGTPHTTQLYRNPCSPAPHASGGLPSCLCQQPVLQAGPKPPQGGALPTQHLGRQGEPS